MKVTGTVTALLSQYCSLSPDDLNDPKCLGRLAYCKPEHASQFTADGYTIVGEAEITFKSLGRDALVTNKVAALREQAVSIRAKATAECTKIEGQIQQLLCIENSTVSLASVVGDDDGIPF